MPFPPSFSSTATVVFSFFLDFALLDLGLVASGGALSLVNVSMMANSQGFSEGILCPFGLMEAWRDFGYHEAGVAFEILHQRVFDVVSWSCILPQDNTPHGQVRQA